MQSLYTSEKQKFDKYGVDMLYLHFYNGDSVSLCKQELLELSINLYDGLVVDGKGFSPVAESGRIVINVAQKSPQYPSDHIYNMSGFKKDRKTYIENRCVKEGGLCAVEFRNDLNWGRTLYGDLSAEMQDGKLVLTYHPKRSGGASGGTVHTVPLWNVTKNNVRSISLDFENCESFVVYDDEIVNLQLQFDPELSEGSDALYRRIKGGDLTIKIGKSTRFRETHFLTLSHPSRKQLEERLVGASDTCAKHDICRLSIRYQDGSEEDLEIDDIRPEKEWTRTDKAEREGYPDFVGGDCRRQSDGSIKIMFGSSPCGKIGLG